ncbi:hypothetical protein ABT033_31310 [Streptomyces pharetrae]|uniref:hypothetical protein n=1 Tax=Streptomyces pharetrae TaxID=291370 RepID=UPI00335FE75C
MTDSPTPAAASAQPDPVPFDPKAFPADLIAAQRTVAELFAALHAHQATLPWSREPHPGWTEETERGREQRGRPASPGWSEEDAAEYDRLFAALREATAVLQTHPWWGTCRANGVEGTDMVAVRQALKIAEGAVPLRQDDVQQTA